MIEYKCPQCGDRVTVEYVLTNPPITCYKCIRCDYHKDDRAEIEKRIEIAPS